MVLHRLAEEDCELSHWEAHMTMKLIDLFASSEHAANSMNR
jgi:hypothetical protein